MAWWKRLLGKSEENISPEFTRLMEVSQNHLAALTLAHQGGWRFGEEAHWNFDQQEGLLRLSFDDGKVAEAPAQIIGTLDSQAKTWMWAWHNPSIRDSLKADVLRVKQYGEQHQIVRLTTPIWNASETDAWAMTALAVKLCEAQGAYRGSAGSTYAFFTFGEIKLSRA